MTATARKKSPLVLIRGNVRQEVRTAQVDERPTTPIGLKPATNCCRICGIPTKKPNGHYRCVSLVARRKRYVELVDQARHMAQVAGDYVRARI